MPFPNLPASLLAALTERGYAEPTPVQAAVLQPEAVGRDLLVSAQTGSGKTVAFGLAMAAELLACDRPEANASGRESPAPVKPEAERLPPPGAPLALVVAPTRELALQVQAELTWLYGPAGGRVVSGVGGTDPVAERRALARGAHIVAGTPGRLRDHLERGNLDPKSIRAVVLDEADEMLDMGFREELEAILETTPAERRTLLFSATVPKGIAQLAKQYQRDALRISAGDEGSQHGDIDYQALLIAPHETERAVVNALRFFEARAAMVFCRTRATVARLHGNLAERGFAAVALSGELSQAERNRALQGLRDGRARVCVATDVAARGIDLPDLGLVIHADMPTDPETLLHRSGRTGRAGRKGTSVLLVPHNRRRAAERLLAEARVKANWGPAPSAEAIRAQDDTRILAQALETTAEEPVDGDLDLAKKLLAERSPEAVAAALVQALRAPLAAPEELAAVADRGPAGPRVPRESGPQQEGVWFRMNLGRANGNADPRWVLPFLCRRGHVTRQEIGRIKVQDRETQFEVAPWAAGRFAAAAQKPGEDEDAHIEILPLQGGAGGEGARRPPLRGPRPPHHGGGEHRQRRAAR
ncbi:DEAD/DEAH box helicase [Roseicella aquatilis]|uniref:DEAD/DEAH box helicase n=1 Tax=Roseicella aquatilis TaxID=2527868 RepID=A0A4R4DTG2_9PROT|nr:DEAD/DEAH box helicase [Roseicella aquatilis]TCZ66006.1 DEAD/DEAH box helicase [Roseicella aquatilis]